jgi:hypothetical protein
MIPLDITGATIATGFFHALGATLALLGGSFLIIVYTFFALVGSVIFSVYKGIEHASFIHAFRVLLRAVTYLIGIGLALLFMLVATVLFSISFLKLFVIAIAIVFVAAFVVRETFLLLIFKRFGRYIFYLTTLHQTSKVVYNYVKTEKGAGGEGPHIRN